ncbi:DinB family protein [Chitinophaga vietnamensis]|uniref:DinB family protein n=1 Tax=Chitinophaga vietnamensis TaxID=2593957 RepID=UPI001177859C|nr:DinB family protein [Chitinophaga vietnamensis]
MKKNAITPDPEYFNRYINLVPDVDHNLAFEQSLTALENFITPEIAARADYAYAPGKWTIKQVIQHITDTERVFNYRAMNYARGNEGPLPGFEENDFAANAPVAHRSLQHVLDELIITRKATIAMYNTFPDELLLRTGTAWKYRLSVLALGFTSCGHQLHHFNIIRERYL